ncbi:GGDEF domain-containing protein [Thalassotalea nanhaiensis]|uniref:diguanylate cyclase n=1 Tax=Thalassotalea nanhaiensis TaxID=3065648 RepID=A0ABY9TLB9_9GAMM|nr:GGDEF domain-containing protein [Colwelliaceae bacterium SQ345]
MMFKFCKFHALSAMLVATIIGFGVYTLVVVNQSSRLLERFYDHPFTVSKSSHSIVYHIAEIKHLIYRQTVITDDKQNVIPRINQLEQDIVKQFDVIFKQFLGDKKDIEEVYQSYSKWFPVVEHIPNIENIQDKNWLLNNKAELDTLFLNIENTEQEVKDFYVFAFSKANEFRQTSATAQQHAVVFSFITTLFILLLIAATFYTYNRRMLAIKREKNELQGLVNQYVMVAELDVDGKVERASDALCHYIEKTEQELLGQPSHFFDLSPTREQIEQKIWSVINSGNMWHGEIRRYNNAGKLQWLTSRIQPIFSRDDKIRGFTNVLIDSTNKQISLIDPLTSLPNRRSYEQCIVSFLETSKQYQLPIGLAILDIDYFKKYNDNYGHPQGDKALVTVASCLQQCLLDTEHEVFRLGGEEFAILVKNFTYDETEFWLNDLRKHIQQLGIVHEFSAKDKFLTVSIGCHFKSNIIDMSDEEIYLCADKALYLAKLERNSVFISK